MCGSTSPGGLPTLYEKGSGIFYVHRILLYYTRDRRLKVSSEILEEAVNNHKMVSKNAK